MKKIIAALCAIFVGASLSACHNRLIHNRAEEYHNAKSIPPMIIPSEYSALHMSAYYPISAPPAEDDTPIDLYPPTVKAESSGEVPKQS